MLVTSRSAPQSGQGTISPRIGLFKEISASHSGQVADIAYLLHTFETGFRSGQQKTLPVCTAWKGIDTLASSQAQAILPGQGDFLLPFFENKGNVFMRNKVAPFVKIVNSQF
jgi:hypothetical protein